MAKLSNPFHSLRAHGSIRRLVTVRRRGKGHVAQDFPDHPDANTTAQQGQRLMFQMCIDLWHTVPQAERLAWERLARPFHMSGYSYYLSQCLKPNPGVYLPLAGGTMQGAINMDSNRITDLPSPGANSDPARKSDLDAHSALESGVHGLQGLLMFSVVQTSNQTVQSGVITTLNFHSKEKDVGTCFNLTTDRHTPNLEGWYLYLGCVKYLGFTADKFCVLVVYKNGVAARELCRLHSSHIAPMGGQGGAFLYMNGSTDYVTAVTYQNSGVGQNTDGAAARTYFQGFLIPQSG